MWIFQGSKISVADFGGFRNGYDYKCRWMISSRVWWLSADIVAVFPAGGTAFGQVESNPASDDSDKG